MENVVTVGALILIVLGLFLLLGWLIICLKSQPKKNKGPRYFGPEVPAKRQ